MNAKLSPMKWWVTEECVSTEAQWRLYLFLARLDTGGRRVCGAGCGWWWMRTEREKDEAWNRMRMKDREVLAGTGAGRGKETVRQRWRDWEWRKNEGQRETNLLWKLLMFAPLSCTVASRLNLHLLRQYQAKCIGEVFLLRCQTCEGQRVNEEDTGRAETSDNTIRKLKSVFVLEHFPLRFGASFC